LFCTGTSVPAAGTLSITDCRTAWPTFRHLSRIETPPLVIDPHSKAAPTLSAPVQIWWGLRRTLPWKERLMNHMAAVSINYFAYNFIRTLRVSPAMAAGVTSRLFDVMDLVNLLVESESKKAA
jgi:hypothetical protein